jgi:PAS domain S-box-containing protein
MKVIRYPQSDPCNYWQLTAEDGPVNSILPKRERADRIISPAALDAAQSRARRLFDSAGHGILILDPETLRITEVNPFACALLGYRSDELIGWELWEIGLLKDQATSRAAFLRLQEKGSVRYENLPLESKVHGRRVVDFAAQACVEGGRNIIQCELRDKTEQKQLEQSLAAALTETDRRGAEAT